MMQLSELHHHPSPLGQLIRLARRIAPPINLIFISGSYEKQDLLPAEAHGRHRMEKEDGVNPGNDKGLHVIQTTQENLPKENQPVDALRYEQQLELAKKKKEEQKKRFQKYKNQKINKKNQKEEDADVKASGKKAFANGKIQIVYHLWLEWKQWSVRNLERSIRVKERGGREERLLLHISR
ncbi:uncharacterized [Tachysurus ichikawai]